MMEVQVVSSFEDALRIFKRMIKIDGVFVQIKLRETYPNITERKKAKQRAAIKRKLDAERRKHYREQHRRKRVHDRDDQIARFNLSHRIDG
jgi:ribosomal protein S21